MQPIIFAFHFGSQLVHVSAYSFFQALGLLVFACLTLIAYRSSGGRTSDAIDLVLVGAPSAFIGAKLVGYVFSPAPDWSWDFEGAKSGLGGVFVGGLIGWWFARRRGADLAKLADAGTLGALGAFACFRTGCWFAGCCGGKPTQGFFAFPVLQGDPRWRPDLEGIHPTQLYFVALALVLLLVLSLLHQRLRKGTTALLGIGGYLFGSFFIEFFRDPHGLRYVAGLSHNQWIALGVLSAVSTLLLKRRSPFLPNDSTLR